MGLYGNSYREHLHISQYRRNGLDVGAGSLSDQEIPLTSLILRSPTAGGQYHWVSEFSPPWCQKYLSYITGTTFSTRGAFRSLYVLLNRAAGWILATGWQGSVVGLSFLAGTIVRDNFLHLYQ